MRMPKKNDKDLLRRLQAENKHLREQLLMCKKWMQREVAGKAYSINKRRAQRATRQKLDIDSYEEVAKTVEGYFGQLLYINNISTMTPHLVDAEMNFFHFMRNGEVDGFIVTNGYQKALEAIIEELVVKGYRKHAKKKKASLKVNNIHEKTLHKCVTKGYMLSVGKVFDLIKKIRTERLEGQFERAFREYLGEIGAVGEYLLSNDCFDSWARVIKTNAFGSRRHAGNIEKDDVQKIRKLMTGNYDDPDGILYQFLHSASDQ